MAGTVLTPPDTRSLGTRVTEGIEGVPPIIALAVMALYGILLTLGSSMAHVNSVQFQNSKKLLGYWYEINWSLNYSFMVPLAIFFALAALSAIPQNIRNLAVGRMIVNAEAEPKSERELLDHYHKIAGIAIYFAMGLTAASFIYAYHEWYVTCFYAGNPVTSDPASKGLLPGWNLAPTVPSTGASPAALRVFGFFAYTAEGAVGAIFLFFCTMILTFAAWLYGFTSEKVGDELIPNVVSPDKRRGFESFEPFLRNVLLASLFFFGVFFLTRLDNAYVVTKDADTLWQFIKSDIFFGFTSSWADLAKNPSQLFSLGPDLTQAIVTVALGLGLTIILAFVVPVTIVQFAASESLDRARKDPLKSRIIEKLRIPSETFDKNMESMVIWPLKYPRVVELLTFLVVAAVCFACYRLTLVFIGVIIAAALKKLYSILTEQKKSTP
jgi:hypothetical protein